MTILVPVSRRCPKCNAHILHGERSCPLCAIDRGELRGYPSLEDMGLGKKPGRVG